MKVFDAIRVKVRITDPVTDPRVKDPRVTDPRVKDLRVKDPVTDPSVNDPRVKDPKDPVYDVLGVCVGGGSMTALRDSVNDTNSTSDHNESKVSKRGMKMFTRFGSLTGSLTLGSLTLKINIKKPVASLVVCCLLFGSLTLGSGTLSLTLGAVTLSSCSPKNNSAVSMTNRSVINPDTDATSDTVAKEKAEEKKEDTKEKEDQKDGHIMLDTPKGATWGVPVASGITSVVVSLVGFLIMLRYADTMRMKYSLLFGTVVGYVGGALAGGGWNWYKDGGFWSGTFSKDALLSSLFTFLHTILCVYCT